MTDFTTKVAKLLGSMDEFRGMPIKRQKWLVDSLLALHNEFAKPGTMGAVQTHAVETETLTAALRAHCGLSPNWQAKHNAAMLVTLRERGATPDDVQDFMTHWRQDWRGKEGSPPTLAQVVELWYAFVRSDTAPADPKAAARARYDAETAETMRLLAGQ